MAINQHVVFWQQQTIQNAHAHFLLHIKQMILLSRSMDYNLWAQINMGWTVGLDLVLLWYDMNIRYGEVLLLLLLRLHCTGK